MDLLGFFFFMDLFFWSDICVGVFLYLSRILTGSRAREARATTACVGRKLGMGGFFFELVRKARNGSTGPHMSRDAPPTCGTESSEWV